MHGTICLINYWNLKIMLTLIYNFDVCYSNIGITIMNTVKLELFVKEYNINMKAHYEWKY